MSREPCDYEWFTYGTEYLTGDKWSKGHRCIRGKGHKGRHKCAYPCLIIAPQPKEAKP